MPLFPSLTQADVELLSALKVALSFFVCNLLVVVTYTSRLLLHDRDGTGTTSGDTSTINDDDFTTRLTRPAQTTSLCLTTVDLDIPADCQITQSDGDRSIAHLREG